MIDMRKDLLRYLDAKQHIWNTCFVDIMGSLYECEPLDSYEEIDRRLFVALICRPLGITLDEGFRVGREPMPSLLVRSRTKTMHVIASKPSTDGSRNQYWEDASSDVSGLEGQFVGFFQWDLYDHHCMSQVRFQITQFPAQPAAVGRDAIVDILNVDFLGLPASKT